jgi:hypothetical protein
MLASRVRFVNPPTDAPAYGSRADFRAIVIARSAHHDRQDRRIVIAGIAIVITRIGLVIAGIAIVITRIGLVIACP